METFTFSISFGGTVSSAPCRRWPLLIRRSRGPRLVRCSFRYGTRRIPLNGKYVYCWINHLDVCACVRLRVIWIIAENYFMSQMRDLKMIARERVGTWVTCSLNLTWNGQWNIHKGLIYQHIINDFTFNESQMCKYTFCRCPRPVHFHPHHFFFFHFRRTGQRAQITILIGHLTATISFSSRIYSRQIMWRIRFRHWDYYFGNGYYSSLSRDSKIANHADAFTC